MWVIRCNRRFYRQGPNQHWYSTEALATHFIREEDAHYEAREVLQLDPLYYALDPYYPPAGSENLPARGERRPQIQPSRYR